MKRSSKIIILLVAGVSLLIASGVIYIKQYLPEHNWSISYNYKSPEPYGTKVLHDLLKDKYKKQNFVVSTKKLGSIINKDDKNSLIFYIGYGTYHDSTTIEWLKEYINRGNKMCIASEEIPFNLLHGLFESDSSYLNVNTLLADSIHTKFNSMPREYMFHFQLAKDTAAFNWTYFSTEDIDEHWNKARHSPLSVVDSSRINFLKIDYGKGAIYLYTTPLFLTNYFMINKNGFNYSNQFFLSIGSFDKIYWDANSRISRKFSSGKNLINTQSPIEFIMSNTALRLAWYILWAGLVLFILFKLKRKQTPIRIIRPDKNTSIEYAKAVGLLHYKTSSYSDLTDRLMKYFYLFITNRYGISRTKEQQVLINKLSIQSGIQAKRIETIFKIQLKIKYNPEPEASHLMLLHAELEYFYKNCK